jgi:hypothetical protein
MGISPVIYDEFSIWNKIRPPGGYPERFRSTKDRLLRGWIDRLLGVLINGKEIRMAIGMVRYMITHQTTLMGIGNYDFVSIPRFPFFDISPQSLTIPSELQKA